MRAGLLRSRLTAALEAAMRNREAEAVALTADRTKAMAVAVAGLADDEEVDIDTLEVGTGRAAVILGYHPEHVRRLIRTGRVRARRIAGDYRLRLNDLWPLLESRYREPGRRRLRIRRP
jgi:hypothetical protein